jgi:proline dehydrogenase
LHRTAADMKIMNAQRARVRLCKGAYREAPSVAVQGAGPVRERYRSLAAELLLHGTYPALATHDENLLAAAATTAAEHGIAKTHFEFQLLYGVRPEIQQRLAAAGYRVRVYVPFGTYWARYFRRRVTERRANLVFALRSLVGS